MFLVRLFETAIEASLLFLFFLVAFGFAMLQKRPGIHFDT